MDKEFFYDNFKFSNSKILKMDAILVLYDAKADILWIITCSVLPGDLLNRFLTGVPMLRSLPLEYTVNTSSQLENSVRYHFQVVFTSGELGHFNAFPFVPVSVLDLQFRKMAVARDTSPLYTINFSH